MNYTRINRFGQLRSAAAGDGASRVQGLANQGAIPDTEQQFLELGEPRGPELGAPVALDLAEDVVDLRVGGAPASGHADDPRAPFVGRIRPDQIAEALEALEELVHGLLAHARALSERTGANPVRPRELQHRHVRDAEIV